jgi:hypothetical protein
MVGRIRIGLVFLGVLFGFAQGARAQELPEGQRVVDEIRTHLADLEDQRAAIIKEKGAESEEARILSERIRCLEGAVASLARPKGEPGPERRLDVSFQGAPITEVLDYLAAEGGLRFAHAPGVLEREDRVTARMSGVLAVEAAEAILRATDYTFDFGPGLTVVIYGKDEIGVVQRELALLQAEVEILELMLRKIDLEEMLRRREGGEEVRGGPMKEFLGVLATKGTGEIVLELEGGEKVACRMPRMETDSGVKVSPEVAAMVRPLEVGDAVRVLCSHGDQGWVLRKAEKAR